MDFSTARLQRVLASLPKPPCYLIAFSGGLDSSVLLHAMARLRDSLGYTLRAVHVDHGLQPDAGRWSTHCRERCEALRVPLETVRLELVTQRGESPEAQAREARYQALAARLDAKDCLVTAHHLDDQAETLMLQLLRGAGPSGMAAMPACRPLGAGFLLRPLLEFPRDTLRQWAAKENVNWIEDPSNTDIDFDRNYLRHRIMPLLRQRWPGYAVAMGRSARHLADAAAIVASTAAVDLVVCRGATANRLSIGALAQLERPRQRGVLRVWIADNGWPTADAGTIDRILDELVAARADARPLITWEGAETRRYRGEIWLTGPLPSLDDDTEVAWPHAADLDLPAGLGRLTLEPVRGAPGLPAAWWREARVVVRFRQDGLQCRILGRSGRRPLKKIFQEFGVPPWIRDRVPLVFVDDQLAAVGDYCRCSVDGAADPELGNAYRIRWCPPAGLR